MSFKIENMPKKGKKKGKKAQSGLGPTSRAMAALSRSAKSAGVPPYHNAVLVYPVAFTSSSMATNVWDWQFRLNSLFDPDYTGSGNQPTTFDQWMALYDRYRVIATTVDLTVTETAQNVIALAGAPTQDAAPTLTYAGVLGLRGAKRGTQAGYFCSKRVVQTVLMKDVFGVDEEAMMSELSYSGTSGASAASVCYYTIAVQSSAATGAVMVEGELRFAVRFEDAHANNVSMRAAAAACSPGPAMVTTTVAGPVQRSRSFVGARQGPQ